MKCPYRDFQDCIVEQCPSCVYQEIKNETIEGKYPNWMDLETAIKSGMAWKSTKLSYKFVSCKLIDNNVQPIPATKQVVNNTNTVQTSIAIRKSVF